MNDRQLLELAAKACGGQLIDTTEGYPYWGHFLPHSAGPWDPLTDDSDALRLAVKLHLSLTLNSSSAAAGGVDANLRQVFERIEVDDGGLSDATRRAIVRAAAAIGATL